MYIKDNDKNISRCDLCGNNCGLMPHHSTIGRVAVTNILAAEICSSCIPKVVEHVQKLMSKEAVAFYREIYMLSIDPHGDYRDGA